VSYPFSSGDMADFSPFYVVRERFPSELLQVMINTAFFAELMPPLLFPSGASKSFPFLLYFPALIDRLASSFFKGGHRNRLLLPFLGD